MFSLADSEQFQTVIQDLANRLLEEGKWAELLGVLTSLPSPVVRQVSGLQLLHDFVLSCWALAKAGQVQHTLHTDISGLIKFH